MCRTTLRGVWVLALWGMFACSDKGQLADAGRAKDAAVDGSGFPDGFTLYPCKTPGTTCAAHNPCAIDPICGKDNLCRPTRIQDCSDGLACTDDVCKGLGVCENAPQPGYCVLQVKVAATATEPERKELRCFKDGERSPDDACQLCNAGQEGNALRWSPAEGGECDDKNPCTKDDYCQAGVCKGEDYSKLCADKYSCTDDLCDGKGGCLGNKLKANYCLINDQCVKDQEQDAGGCNVCDVTKSQSAWTPLTQHCMIGGVCKKPGTKDSTGCGICDPSKSTTDWSPLPGVCKIGSLCVQQAAKHPGGCAECDPNVNATGWTVKGNECLINDKCLNPGVTDPTGCSACDPTKSTTSWTPLAGQCQIAGKCYKQGDKHPAGCAECDPLTNATSWTVKGNECLLFSTVCKQPGDKDAGGCNSCDPATSKYAWTPLPPPCTPKATLWSIDFGSSTTTKTGASVLGNSGDHWNAAGPGFNSDYTVKGLLISDKTPTTVDMRVLNLPGNWGWSTTPAINDVMYAGYSYSWSGATATIKFYNLPSGTYSFVSYAHEEGPNGWSGFQITTHATDGGPAVHTSQVLKTDGPNFNGATWVAGSMYVQHSGIPVVAGQVVQVNITNGGHGTGNAGCLINGLQVLQQ